MSSEIPPNPYFNNINFNPSFFTIIGEYLTEAIANSKYLKLIGGTLSGFLGIKRTPRTELDVNGKAVINNTLTSIPANGILGSNGTRLILLEGTVSETPYALGINSGELWYGTSSTGIHNFYSGTNKTLTLDTLGNITAGKSTYTISIIPPTVSAKAQILTSTATDLLLQPTQGYVGIGTTTTQGYPFYVAGQSYFLGKANYDGSIVLGYNAAQPANMQVGSLNGTNVALCKTLNDYSTSAAVGDLVIRSTQKTLIQSGAGVAAITITSGNNVGIGTTDPLTNKLYVNGDLRIDGNTTTFGSIYPCLQLTSTLMNNLAIAAAGGNFSTTANYGDMILRSANRLLMQSGSGASAICIGTNNYVNIGNGGTGVGNPTYPITIYSTSTTGLTISSYANASVASYLGNQTTSITPNIMLGVLGTSAFSTNFYVYSDKRIKKDIIPLENSLDLINKINPVSFKYIDYIERGTINNYGIIAQEIEEIIPEVINSHKDYIPNIYKNVDKYDNELLRLYIKTYDLSVGDKIKIYDVKNKDHHRKIIEKNEDYITIDEPIENYEEGTNLFIYGKEIEDVKNVNYEALFVINIKATQELYQRLKTLEDIIKNLIKN